MNIEKERESFEQFCIKDDEFCIHRYAGDPNYSDDYTQCAWLAWLASANREGYKLVPVEPTDIEIESIKEKHWDMRGCQLCKSDYIDLYKAMIEAQEPTND